MLLFFAISAAVCLIFKELLKKFIQHRSLPPGPYGLPIVGYLPWLDTKHPHLTMTELAKKYGPIYSIKMGSVFTVVLSDAKLVRQAFSSEDFSGRAPLYLTHGIMKGNGIICAQGEKWRETRKFVNTTLRALGVAKGKNKMEEDIMRGVDDLVKRLNKADSVSFDLEQAIFCSMGNVVFQLVFGKTWDEDDPTWKTLYQLQRDGTKLLGVTGAINFLPFLRFLSKYKKALQFIVDGIKLSHKVYEDLLQQYISGCENTSEDDPPHIMGAFSKQMQNMEDNSNFQIEQFNFLMADMFGAGVDTTMTTLRWFLLYIALNPEVQERIHKELDALTEGRPLKLSDMSRCLYLEASISETQRIRPVVPIGIPHGTIKDTTLRGYDIPKGSMILPLQWAIHHNSDAYLNPEQFNPDRFFSLEDDFKKPEEFIPFQAGKRVCVGEEYARALLFLFGGTILQKFNLMLLNSESLDLLGETGITLTPPEHHIIFSPRTPLEESS